MTEPLQKLLIVDDSHISRLIMRNTVARHRRNWSMFESDNGFDAIDMIRMIEPDFVTMDVNMPNMSGIEAAEKIQREFPNVRIALVTANVQEAVRRRAQEMKIGFIEKPINEESVIRTINFFEVPANA